MSKFTRSLKTRYPIHYADHKAEYLKSKGFEVWKCHCGTDAEHNCYIVVDRERNRSTMPMKSYTFNTIQRFSWCEGIPRKDSKYE